MCCVVSLSSPCPACTSSENIGATRLKSWSGPHARWMSIPSISSSPSFSLSSYLAPSLLNSLFQHPFPRLKRRSFHCGRGPRSWSANEKMAVAKVGGYQMLSPSKLAATRPTGFIYRVVAPILASLPGTSELSGRVCRALSSLPRPKCTKF